MKKKIFSVVRSALGVCLLLALLVLPVAAASKYSWQVVGDYEALSNGTERIERFDLPTGYFIAQKRQFVYLADSSKAIWASRTYIYSTLENSGLFWVDDGGEEYLFVPKAEYDDLMEYLNGRYDSYSYLDGRRILDIPDELAHDILNAGKEDASDAVLTDVRDLRDLTQYCIAAYDKTGTIAHNCAMLFQQKNDWYYLDLDALDNTHFDADGNLSFRSGKVPLKKLSGDVSADVDALFSAENFYYTETTYEQKEEPEKPAEPAVPSDFSTVIAWVQIVIFGFLVPIVPFVFGLVLAKKSKISRPRAWYGLTIFAAVWILCSAGIVCMLLI